MQKTGSIYNADRENFRNAKALGEWNDYEITVVGQKYTVCLNGKVVNEYVSDKGRGLEGFIGVQNHDPSSKVSLLRRSPCCRTEATATGTSMVIDDRVETATAW